MNRFFRPALLGAAVCGVMASCQTRNQQTSTGMVPPAAQLEPTKADHAMVTSVNSLASKVGVTILMKGGNAVDAAIATGFALAVVYPYAGNLGGGGFMLIHLASGTNTVIDYRETAPSAASNEMYVGDLNSSKSGYRASGAPGTVAGFYKAFESYGSHRLSWAELIEPARRLAKGHSISQFTIASLTASSNKLAQIADSDSKKIYLNNGKGWGPDDVGRIWKQQDLAETLRRLQINGPNEFYRGVTATNIANDMAAHGGTITLADLNDYRAIERTPIISTYRGYTVVTVPSPSSGAFLLEMLKMIEPHDLKSCGVNSAASVHLMVEAMKRAHKIRAGSLGDPNFAEVPVKSLLDPKFISRLMANYNPTNATASELLEPHESAEAAESHETTHFSIVDKDGNAVANTFTLNDAYGSGVTIKHTGILMNNEMGDFSYAGKTDAYSVAGSNVNSIVAGKRPASAMIPTMVFEHGTNLLLVTGSPGGRTIISTVLEVIVNVIDFGMNVKLAVETPRFRHLWRPDVIQFERNNPLTGSPPGLSPEAITQLKAMRHARVEEIPLTPGTDSWSIGAGIQGDAETIMVDLRTGQRLGANDSRKRDSAAVGY